MSCFYLCDGVDCSNTENEGVDFLTESLSIYLHKHYNNGSQPQHLCRECVENINEDYKKEKPLIVKDKYSFLDIAEDFEENVDVQ